MSGPPHGFARVLCALLPLMTIGFALTPAGVVRADEPSGFEITKQRRADTVTVVKEQGATVFVISSSNGIGWVKIQTEKAWPMKATVRLEYADGRPWKHLEHFSIANTQARIATSLKQREVEFTPLTDQARREAEKLPPQELAQRVAMSLVQREGKVEILLPMPWLAQQDELTFRWIDLYRN